MKKNEKEKYILSFIYKVLTDDRNQNRYCTTMVGNIDFTKFVRLGDCISYIENKYLELESEE